MRIWCVLFYHFYGSTSTNIPNNRAPINNTQPALLTTTRIMSATTEDFNNDSFDIKPFAQGLEEKQITKIISQFNIDLLRGEEDDYIDVLSWDIYVTSQNIQRFVFPMFTYHYAILDNANLLYPSTELETYNKNEEVIYKLRIQLQNNKRILDVGLYTFNHMACWGDILHEHQHLQILELNLANLLHPTLLSCQRDLQQKRSEQWRGENLCKFLRNSSTLQCFSLTGLLVKPFYQTRFIYYDVANYIILSASKNSNIRHIRLTSLNLYKTLPDLFNTETVVQKLSLDDCFLQVPHHLGVQFDSYERQIELSKISESVPNSSIKHLIIQNIHEPDLMHSILNGFYDNETKLEILSCTPSKSNDEAAPLLLFKKLKQLISQISTLKQIELINFHFHVDDLRLVFDALNNRRLDCRINTIVLNNCTYNSQHTIAFVQKNILKSNITTLKMIDHRNHDVRLGFDGSLLHWVDHDTAFDPNLPEHHEIMTIISRLFDKTKTEQKMNSHIKVLDLRLCMYTTYLYPLLNKLSNFNTPEVLLLPPFDISNNFFRHKINEISLNLHVLGLHIHNTLPMVNLDKFINVMKKQFSIEEIIISYSSKCCIIPDKQMKILAHICWRNVFIKQYVQQKYHNHHITYNPEDDAFYCPTNNMYINKIAVVTSTKSQNYKYIEFDATDNTSSCFLPSFRKFNMKVNVSINIQNKVLPYLLHNINKSTAVIKRYIIYQILQQEK